MIKMITSDMDGTLLAGRDWGTRRLPLDFGETLDELDKRGIRFLAASGRTYPSVRQDFGEYADRIDYICDNGGCLVHQGKVVHEETISRRAMLKMIELTETIPHAHLSLCTARGTIRDFDEDWPGKQREANYTFIVPDLRTVDEPLTKMVLVGDFSSYELKAELDAALGDELNFITSGGHFMDIMKKGIDKGSGIRYFRELWGIDRSECMAFGDDWNDIGQFEEAEWSFAMGNAADDIKSHARFVTDTNANDGVTKAIWKYALK